MIQSTQRPLYYHRNSVKFFTFQSYFFLLQFFPVFVHDVNLRLERRSNSEWKRIKIFKTAALAVVGEDEFALKSAGIISPIKNKRNSDKKPRASRIKGLLPECDQTDEFKRASMLNFGGTSFHLLITYFILCWYL